MSFILTPAAPVEGPSFTPTNEARFEPERGSTFGPALSDARQRLANPEPSRHDPAERRSARAERPDRSEHLDRDARLARPPRSDQPRPERTPQPDRTDDSSRQTEPSGTAATDDPSAVESPANEAVEEQQAEQEPTLNDDATTTPVVPGVNLSNADAASSAELTMGALPLTTANGTAGEGDPVIDLTVDGVAAPEPGPETAEVDTSVINDGVTEVDIDAMTGTTTDAVDSDVAEMGRQAALTSLEQVSDADLSLAERIRPAPAEEVAGPSISLDEADRADPFTQLPGDDAAGEGPIQGRVDETNTARAGATNTQPAATASSDDAPDAVMVDGPTPQVDSVDRPVQQAAINTVPTADTPDTVVVLAREAVAPTEGVKAAPASAAQATASLPAAAEANLWADVRSALDRVRSTGDGQELLMRLRPAELGELLVQVRTQGDHVSVRLVTSSAAAQQTLVDDRLRLAAELARAGFDEGSVDIGQSNTGDANHRGDQGGNGGDADRTGQSFGATTGIDRLNTTRDIFERREPIRTDSGFRPGRTAQSTINITL